MSNLSISPIAHSTDGADIKRARLLEALNGACPKKAALLREIGVKRGQFRMWALHRGMAILSAEHDGKEFSYAEIAAHYGVTRQYVCKVCRQVEKKMRAWACA